MEDQLTPLPWEHPDWLEGATAWIQAQAAAHSLQITGPVEIVHQRPWSTFARLPTDQGTIYFKAPAPVFQFEAALTEALARWRPDCTVPLLAIDRERGWLLSAEAGTTLRSLDRSVEQVKHWLKLLPFYSEFQIEMAARVPELLAVGMPDRRLEQLPHLYAQLLDDTQNLRVGLEPGLTQAEHQRLRALQPRVARLCEQLAAYGLPVTLAHEELHENNILVQDDRYIFTDWSDSSVGHPFFSMVVTPRSIAAWLKLDAHGPELEQVRDAYLEPWTKFERRGRLLAALDLAYRLGRVNRALSWHHDTKVLSGKYKTAYAGSLPGWLQDFLAAELAVGEAG
jgi:hypothetical protein